MNGRIVQAAIMKYVYTVTGPRRVKPSQEPEKSMYRALRAWRELTVPPYVLVAAAISGAILIEWNGSQTKQGDPPWKRPVVGRLTDLNDGVWGVNVDPTYTFPPEPKPKPAELKTEFPMPNRPPRENNLPEPKKDLPKPENNLPEPEPILPVPECSGPEGYTGDPITVDSTTGHFIGDDGFRVPKDFAEFYQRYPNYIRNWVRKRLGRFHDDDDVQDWTQDLILHLKYLPANSKHRQPGANGRPNGCQDVIETFNPYAQYGASERRWRYYVNFCLTNKFNTVATKRQKNPILRPGNIPYGAHSSASEQAVDVREVPDDEYVHANSDHLVRAAARAQKQHDDHLFTLEFIDFVNKKDPTVLPAIEAIKATGTQGEAAAMMGVDEQDFARFRNRLKVLAECFEKGTEVPKQRKPYKRRAEVAKAATASE